MLPELVSEGPGGPSKLPPITLLLSFLSLRTVNDLLIPGGGLPLLSSDEPERRRPLQRVSPDAALPRRLNSQYYYGTFPRVNICEILVDSSGLLVEEKLTWGPEVE